MTQEQASDLLTQQNQEISELKHQITELEHKYKIEHESNKYNKDAVLKKYQDYQKAESEKQELKAKLNDYENKLTTSLLEKEELSARISDLENQLESQSLIHQEKIRELENKQEQNSQILEQVTELSQLIVSNRFTFRTISAGNNQEILRDATAEADRNVLIKAYQLGQLAQDLTRPINTH